MDEIKIGDKVTHRLLTTFTTTVLDIKPCEPEPDEDEEVHNQYQVTDPDGNLDWLCGYDVRKANVQ